MHWPQICIPEIEYYQKGSSHAQIWPQGTENQRSKVMVGSGGVGGGCRGKTPRTARKLAGAGAFTSLSIVQISDLAL